MNRRVTTVRAAALVAATAVGTAALAYALWFDHGSAQIPPVAVGVVSFDGYGQSGTAASAYSSDTTAPQYSLDGGPVVLTLPAKEILQVLDRTGLSPEPVIWRFTVEGYAQGIAGMNVGISMGDQIGPGTTVTSLRSGIARQGTILGFSTLKVYLATMNGDCSNVPETPEGEEKNIYMYGTQDSVLQLPGAYAGSPTTQDWCVAMDFNQAADGMYANEVQAAGIGENGASHAGVAQWKAAVAFPVSLDPLGLYRNRVDVVGTAEDGTVSRAHNTYEAMIYPDPDNEPDVTIILDPTVTNPNSQFTPT